MKNEFIISKNSFSKILYLISRIYQKFFVKTDINYLPGDDPFSINYWKNRYIHSGYFQKINESEWDKKSFASSKKDFILSLIKKYNFLAIHIRRGDYLTKKHSMHGIIHERYFLEEAKKFLSQNSYKGIKIFLATNHNLQNINHY